ncbi:uncharacterized protein OCT59_011714 [Rhizophagus irregularis]|uniref:Uncharacterized protein n=2 Tax=Rhizophagus irregularis TaxID=588596 RepID=A0A015IAY9_RHIIW|nr:hypothetical protein RirG_265850 [Rhizophagus irregularis DAOM 197198w]UZO00591.1 hypothetical protein OCT59_011714 [Rhizophagus irregularis]GBC39333.1 hypothetical protein GLOIN_2v1597232 [Rhizophagus irregularis DAOM 181602=DAOM 197198]CAG8594417.1 19608_t:CDS:2 [Rhizophagus irregularis]
MSSQNQNQLSRRIYKSTQEQEKILGGTPKQVHKINELEKVGNKVGPAAASSSQLYYAPPHHSSKEKAPSRSIGGATIYNLSLEAQTHDSDGVKTFPPIPNAQVHDFALEARGFASQNSGHLDLSDKYDGRPSSSPPFSNHYAKITSILNDPQTYDNGDSHQSDQTHDGKASAIILNFRTHDGRPSSSPPFSNHYAKITSILNDPQTYENCDGHQSDQTHDGKASAIILNFQTHDGRPSSSPPFSDHYAKITSILNDPQTYDNGDGHQSDQTHDEKASATIPNPQTHDGRTSINPQTYGRWASSSPILLRYSSNYYARISSILNGLQTLPSFPWFLNNPNETNDVSLPPIYNNSTPQQIYSRTFESDHKPEDLDYHFVYK